MKQLFGKRHNKSDDGSFILLARFPELWQADLAVSLLASEGIEAWSADELFINGTDHATERDGFGVIVNESDATAAHHILQMAERGDLALPDDHQVPSEEGDLHENEYPEPPGRYGKVDTLNPQLSTRNSPAVRCPRCGSENIETRKGIRALFNPGYRCRVCQWEW